MTRDMNSVLLDVVSLLEDHLSERITLDWVAQRMHYSPYHLHRMFSAGVGMPMGTYLKRRRMTEGARQLAEPSRPVLDIALSVGYESQQAFTGAFKALYKLPPARFRAEGQFYPLQLPFSMERPLPRLDAQKSRLRQAEESDLPAWMAITLLAVDGYPCLIERDYRRQLRWRLRQGDGWVLELAGAVAGVLLLSVQKDAIDFWAVHPVYRRQGGQGLLLALARQTLLAGREIRLTTFRAGDQADTGHRQELLRLGFQPREELVEFGYPTQRFVLPAGKGVPG